MEPLTLEDGKVLVWSKKAVLAGCAAVGLTVGALQQRDDVEVEAAISDVLDWLTANKPKSAGVLLPVRGESERASEAEKPGCQAGTGMTSPGLAAAEVEGDADGGVSSSEQGGDGEGVGDGGGSGEASRGDLKAGTAHEENGEGGGDGDDRPAKRARASLFEGLPKRQGERRERREDERLQRSAERQRGKEQERDKRAPIPPPRSVGRSKAATELEEHRRATKKREKAREESKGAGGGVFEAAKEAEGGGEAHG